MMAGPRPRGAVLSACLSLAILSACTPTPPTTFYTLSNVTTAVPVSPPSAQDLVIGLGPLTLPQYLDRPDIVTRDGANQMRLGEFAQWAEPLEPLLSRIMAEDLFALLGAKDVVAIPQRGELPLDRVVTVDFVRFDANEAGEVTLDARWRIYRGDNESLIGNGRSLLTEQGAAVPDYDAITAAMSRAVGRMTAEIAAVIAEPPAAARKRR